MWRTVSCYTILTSSVVLLKMLTQLDEFSLLNFFHSSVNETRLIQKNGASVNPR